MWKRRTENIFWVPREARWSHLQASAKSPEIGILLDQAMAAIEKDSPSLKGVLPQDYGREELDKRRLGELIDLVGTIGLGDADSRSQDILGRVYEYFLGQFADAEGKKGGEFYNPTSIVRLLVAMLEPHKDARIYDPCGGSGGMFVSSENFVEDHGNRKRRHSTLDSLAPHASAGDLSPEAFEQQYRQNRELCLTPCLQN